MQEREATGKGIDLLQFGPLKSTILCSGFPYLFQVGMLVLFVGFAVLAWGLFPPEGVADKLYAKTNLVNLVIWGLWWPAMVLTTIFFGRVWCMICPLEFVANLTERLGRRLGISQWRLRRWLRDGFLILGLYALIQMLVAGIHLHRIPAYTSIFLWMMLGLAAFVGFFFADRAFCRGFWPVGLLLGTYGRGSMLVVRSKSRETCQDCEGKECVAACERTRLDARSCPSLLNPAKLSSNQDCLVCGQCLKSCRPDNMQLLIRSPFHGDDSREAAASWPVTLFVMLVSGFVLYELCSEWPAAESAFQWVPVSLAGWVGATGLVGWFNGVWMLIIVPLALWYFLGLITVVSRESSSVVMAWRRLALPLVVVISAGHLAKGLAKLSSWSGFLPFAINNPNGIQTALEISTGQMPQPAPLLSLAAVSLFSGLFVLAAIGFALRELRLRQISQFGGIAFSILLLGAGSVFLITGWGIFAP
jgi:hypothetical protein